MKLATIGAGKIGGTLGTKWAKAGHNVNFGVPDPDNPAYEKLQPLGKVASPLNAIENAEIVLMAIPGTAMSDFGAQYGKLLAGKIVIDATNNPRLPVLNSLETLHTHAPNAHLVRAFNIVGAENLAEPRFGNTPLDMFYCGYAPARPNLDQLIQDAGMRPIYLGDIDFAPLVDGLTRVWFTLAFSQGHGRRIAFKLLEQ